MKMTIDHLLLLKKIDALEHGSLRDGTLRTVLYDLEFAVRCLNKRVFELERIKDEQHKAIAHLLRLQK
jgi:hypothetical protein